MIIHLDIVVFGRVQGVFFRASTKAVADQLGIKGTVRNLEDGSVFIEAEADKWRLGQFLDWCNEGPEKAIVEKVDQRESQIRNYRNFEVIKRKK